MEIISGVVASLAVPTATTRVRSTTSKRVVIKMKRPSPTKWEVPLLVTARVFDVIQAI